MLNRVYRVHRYKWNLLNQLIKYKKQRFWLLCSASFDILLSSGCFLFTFWFYMSKFWAATFDHSGYSTLKSPLYCNKKKKWRETSLEFDFRKGFKQFCLGEQVVCSFWREVKSASGNNNVQFSGGPKIISHCAHSDVEIRKIIMKFAQNH